MVVTGWDGTCFVSDGRLACSAAGEDMQPPIVKEDGWVWRGVGNRCRSPGKKNWRKGVGVQGTGAIDSYTSCECP